MNNWHEIFYWLTVADNARSFFEVMTWIFTGVAAVSTFIYLICKMNEEDECVIAARKWIFWSYPFMIVFWLLLILTPSKKDSLLIIAGGGAMNFLTTDTTAKQLPHEMTNFIVTEIKNMANEAKVELDVRSTKEKILEEAKQMSSDELIKRMATDSNFARVVLDK